LANGSHGTAVAPRLGLGKDDADFHALSLPLRRRRCSPAPGGRPRTTLLAPRERRLT
jgi:hypothetical protein